jgi:hypothetical protein
MKTINCIRVLPYVVILLADHGRAENQHTPQPVTGVKEQHYESLGRAWAERLWKTNDCCLAVFPFDRRKAKWTPYSGIWTNEFKNGRVSAWQDPVSEMLPWKRVKMELGIGVTNRREQVYFEFLDDGSDRVVVVRNPVFADPHVPCRRPDYKAIHTDEQQARQKAAEYAALFGAPGLWDKTKFELRSFGLTYGVWTYCLTPFVNGYPTLYPVTVRIADLPGYPLGGWLSCLYQIPANLPVKVALTAEAGKRKGVECLKKYFPLKDIIPRLTFHGNRLEYIHPNYNYIRPEDGTGFSGHQPKHAEVALAWANTFKKPDGEGFPWVVIYVDAATGEMLGGAD